MRVYIDFSIFYGPVNAYGNVTGHIELPSFPKIGDSVTIYKGDVSSYLGFSGRLLVKSIVPVPGYGPEKTVVGLDDVVVSSEEVARNLALTLETECGLFCIEYSRKK